MLSEGVRIPVPVEAEGLHRAKREWIRSPRNLKENHDYTGLDNIAIIRSDKENFTRIIYSLTGPGADKPPVGVFSINPNTGYVRIHSILDREKIAVYNLKGVARFTNMSYAESDIDLPIRVEDVNDCPPVIKAHQISYVNESSATGTYVMKVIATDADQENTLHSQIYYRIDEQSNAAGMFLISTATGEIMVRQNTLDRETKDTYKLKIIVSDMNGQPGGNTGSGEIEIRILDINDNVPTLEKESYEGSVEENTINVEVMRIKAIDMDLIHTDNWLAVYEIVSGNEGGYFSITTDSKTNEGIIMINKALDYEELKTLNLDVAVSNKASYSAGTTVSKKSYPIKINVLNQKEGPRFQPTVKVVTISEDHSSIFINKVITNYAAIDSDTLKTATNVRYAKLRDDDNWLIIDEKTADIRLNKLPDRESKFLINGTYYAEIICITNDGSKKTATGTIAIQVQDFNDHCPELTATTHTMCLEDNVIYVTAKDMDEFPNSVPFEFTVIQGSSKGKWTVEHFNETTAILRDQANLWPGTYKVAVEVKDQQGKSCTDVQIMDITVCTCNENTKTCVLRRTTTAGLGAAGILLLLLGLLLLLLVPLLLLFCLCGGAAALGNFKPIPFDAKQQLIQYHTEGQGEDKKSNHATQQSQQKDGLLVYDYEGEESLAGSVGCCSLLENDDDLTFLNDLGPKFKTLAEICQGSALVSESVDVGVSLPPIQPVSPVRPSTSSHTHVHTHTETVRDRDHVNINTLNFSNVASGSSTIVQKEHITQGSSTLPKVHVQDKVVIPSQTLLIQQPTMYYAASPMYVVEPQPQVVLVAGGTQQQAVSQVGQVGLSQGLVQVGGLQGSQGVVLLDRQVGVGEVTGQVIQGLPQGTVSRSRKVLVVEHGSSGAEHGEHLVQGFTQTGLGSREQGLEVRGQGVQGFSLGSHSSTGSNEDFSATATPRFQGSQRVVVQHKKVSVSERNIESSTRA
uniref:Desmoglein 2 n=1 Tax=Lates calcarifer TaxID=8187 RepID=A0A4W6DBL3_LATCA